MKLLITGAAGYIGSRLVALLRSEHPEIKLVLFDNLSRANSNVFFQNASATRESAHFISGDVLDIETLRASASGVDVIIHLAAHVADRFGSAPAHVFDYVNHWGTANIARVALENAVEHVVYASSSAVYPELDDPVSWQTTPSPPSHYGQSKWNGERQLQRLTGSIPVTTIRLGTVYGFAGCLRTDSIINKFAFNARWGVPLVLFGSGRQKRSFIHLDDAANVLCALALRESPLTQVYDAVSQVASPLDVSELLRDVMPGVEMAFTASQLHDTSLIVQTDARLSGIIRGGSMEDDLRAMCDQLCI